MAGLSERLNQLPEEKRLYALRQLAGRLRHAGHIRQLHMLLMDFEWLDAKLRGTNTTALLSDFGEVLDSEDLKLLHATLRLSAHIVGPDPTQLASQLLGRMSDKVSDLPEHDQAAARE